MKLNLKPYFIAIIIIILIFIIIGVVGKTVVPGGMEQLDKKYIPYMKGLIFSLFFLAQHKIGNSTLPLVKQVNDNIHIFIWCIWGFCFLALFIALPYMIKDGILKNNFYLERNTESIA